MMSKIEQRRPVVLAECVARVNGRLEEGKRTLGFSVVG
jgi:hypothetical protein